MGLMQKALAALVVALALGLAGSLFWASWERGKANTLAVQNEALGGAVRASQAQAKRRASTDAAQAQAKAQGMQAVLDVQTAINKEEAIEKDNGLSEPRPTASAGQLERLRKLHAASADAIRSASKLP